MNPPSGELPPQDRQAEAALVGAVLRDNQIYDDVRPLVAAEDFYFAVYGQLFAVIGELLAADKPADLVTVYASRLNGDVTGELLADLWTADPTGANAVHHARIVRDHAAARRLIHLCAEMTRAAYQGEPVGELVARFESDVFRVSDSAQSAEPAKLADAVRGVMADLEARSRGEPPRHIPTGLGELDAVIGGLHPGRLVIVAARPSVGKSVVGLHFALNAARRGFGALVVSLEMSAKEWAARALANGCSVPLNEITGSANLTGASARSLVVGEAGVGRNPIWIDDRPGHTADTIAAVARRAVRKHKVGLIVIDYLGLIEHGGFKSDNLATRVGNTTRRLKVLARSLDVPVVCLAQLNREIEKRGDARPQLSDLRDSGAVEQDADDVYMLWPQQQTDTPGYLPAAETELRICVDKQRNGPRAVVAVTFRRPFVRLEPRGPQF